MRILSSKRIPSPHRRKVRNERHKTRKKKKLLIREQNYKCFYCRQDILFTSTAFTLGLITEYQRNNSSSQFLYIQDGSEWFTINKATADHILPIVEGGGITDNIVISCERCNLQRSQVSPYYFLPLLLNLMTIKDLR